MGATWSWRPLCPAYPYLRAAGLHANVMPGNQRGAGGQV